MQTNAKAKPRHPMRRILIGVIGAAVISLAVWLLNPFGLESAEAVHWIRGTTWQNPNLSREANEQLRIEKLRQIGDAAITVLIHDLRGRNEIHSNARLTRLLRWIPQRWQSFLPKSETRVHSRRGAALLAGELGSRARRTVPALLAMLKDGDPAERCDAAVALGRIDERSAEVVAALKQSQDDPITEVRQQSLLALWRLNQADETTAVRLESVLRNTNQSKFESTVESIYLELARLGPEARRLTPALTIGLTNHPGLQSKILAAKALWCIEQDDAPAMYVFNYLTNLPQRPQSSWRSLSGASIQVAESAKELSNIPRFQEAAKTFQPGGPH